MLTCETVAERGLVERFVAARLRNDPDLAEFEAHLLTCSACQEEVRLAMIVRAELGAPRRHARTWLLIGLATAAALVFVIARPTARPATDGSVERGSEEGVPVITTISPAPEAVVTAPFLRFLWHGRGASVQYHLNVTDEHGDIVWSYSTADTLALPPKLRLGNGAIYFWYVDGLLPDGRSATSRAQRFTIGP